MKIGICVLLVIQALLFALGCWQVFQQSAFVQFCGIFNIVVNTIFAGVNVRKLRNIINAG